MASYHVKLNWLLIAGDNTGSGGTPFEYANSGSFSEGDPETTGKYLALNCVGDVSIAVEESVLEHTEQDSPLPKDVIVVAKKFTLSTRVADPGDETKLSYLLDIIMSSGETSTAAGGKLTHTTTGNTTTVKSKYNIIGEADELNASNKRYFELQDIGVMNNQTLTFNPSDAPQYFDLECVSYDTSKLKIYTEQTEIF